MIIDDLLRVPTMPISSSENRSRMSFSIQLLFRISITSRYSRKQQSTQNAIAATYEMGRQPDLVEFCPTEPYASLATGR
jgi:hypothetical protein